MAMSKGRRRRRKSIRFGRVVGGIIALLAITLLFSPLSMEDKTIEVEVGTEFNDEPKITGNVDTSKVGEYKITYKWGLKSATRTINVVDTTAPVIDMQGGSTLYVEDFNNLESLDPGVIVTDNYDEDVKAKRERHKISDSEYEFVYTATDSSGNIAIAKRRILKATGVIYLTFDEGYEAGYTENILNTLKKNDVKATFFITSHYFNTASDLVERMISDGHIIGNHTVNHKSLPSISNEEIENELMKLHQAMYEKFNYEMKYMRPPKGEFNERTLRKTAQLGYKTVMWSFAYFDWDEKKQPNLEESRKIIINNFHCGEIMLLHPNSKTNSEVLDSIIKEAKNQGYQFKLLDEFK